MLNIAYKYQNTDAELQYTINGGSTVYIGYTGNTNCSGLTQVTGLSNGDVIEVSTVFTNPLSGSTIACPTGILSCANYFHTMSASTEYIYITVDGTSSC